MWKYFTIFEFYCCHRFSFTPYLLICSCLFSITVFLPSIQLLYQNDVQHTQLTANMWAEFDKFSLCITNESNHAQYRRWCISLQTATSVATTLSGGEITTEKLIKIEKDWKKFSTLFFSLYNIFCVLHACVSD